MLDLITILCLGLMTGVELSVSAFVNPAVWNLDESCRARAANLLALSFGKAMPFWYALCLILMLADAYIKRHASSVWFLDVAAVITALSIPFSLVLLVPVNNRLARMNPSSPPPHWQEEHKQWDARHRVRILMLVVALALIIWSVVW